jgi:hypothetical protein
VQFAQHPIAFFKRPLAGLEQRGQGR